MQLLCPECCSEEVASHPDRKSAVFRCANCGACFDRDEAHVTLAEAVSALPEPRPDELFTLDAERARAELGDPDGALQVIDPYSDADQLQGFVDAAQDEDCVRGLRDRATILVYPLSICDPGPLLAVDPGCGPTLLGHELKLRRHDAEEPVDFSLRILVGMVAEANGLAAGRAADSERLDRITAFLNRPGQWNGGDVCEFLAEEIVASGRRLADPAA